MYMSTWNVTDARAALPEILRLVAAGEDVTLTRYGQAVAVVVRPDSLRSRRATSALQEGAALGQLLAELAGQDDPDGELSVARADEQVTALRADRDRT